MNLNSQAEPLALTWPKDLVFYTEIKKPWQNKCQGFAFFQKREILFKTQARAFQPEGLHRNPQG